MFNFDTFMGSWMLINNRLIVGQNVSMLRVTELMKELESVDTMYTTVFEVDAFAAYLHLPKSCLDMIKKLEVGGSLFYHDTKFVKVSKNLCVGILHEMQYLYNESAKRNMVKEPTTTTEEPRKEPVRVYVEDKESRLDEKEILLI